MIFADSSFLLLTHTVPEIPLNRISGGTIGCRKKEEGRQASPGMLGDALKHAPPLSHHLSVASYFSSKLASPITVQTNLRIFISS